MSHYDTGRRFEYAVRTDLRDDGYEVIRSAGSKSKIDLVALKPGQTLFVQCKLNGLCPPAERSRLLEFASWARAVPIVAYRDRGPKYRRLIGAGPREFVPWSADGEQP